MLAPPATLWGFLWAGKGQRTRQGQSHCGMRGFLHDRPKALLRHRQQHDGKRWGGRLCECARIHPVWLSRNSRQEGNEGGLTDRKRTGPIINAEPASPPPRWVITLAASPADASCPIWSDRLVCAGWNSRQLLDGDGHVIGADRAGNVDYLVDEMIRPRRARPRLVE